MINFVVVRIIKCPSIKMMVDDRLRHGLDSKGYSTAGFVRPLPWNHLNAVCRYNTQQVNTTTLSILVSKLNLS